MKVIPLIIGISWLYASDTFTDKSTNLMWQDDNDTKIVKKDWNAAKSYCEYLTLNSKDDWRLPNIKELQSIVDIKKNNPAIKDGFRNIVSHLYLHNSGNLILDPTAMYWSSTEQLLLYEIGALNILFYDGSTNSSFKSNHYYVRCVRDIN